MKQKHIIIGLLALLAISCTKQEFIELTTNGSIVLVTAGIENSRVTFNESENMNYIALWENDDAITLNTSKQGSLNYIATVAESGITTFSPQEKGLKNIEGDTVYACYPKSSIIDGAVELPQTNKWTDKDHLPFAYAISYIQNSKVNLQFKHVFAYLELTLTNQFLENVKTSNGDKTISSILLQSTSETLGVVSGFFNFKDKKALIKEASNKIILTTEDEQSKGITSKSFYIPILPQEANIAINIFALHQNGTTCDTLATICKNTPSEGLLAGNVYTLTIGANNTITTDDEEHNIHLETAGTLSKFITETNKYSIKKLKISGPLNGDDIRLIRDMAGRNEFNETEGKLSTLDISKATIQSGGGYYYGNDSTINNSIGKHMFYMCDKLQHIILPESTVTIGFGAFKAASRLIDVTIGDSVTIIANDAFYNCNKLEKIIFGSNLKEIGNFAFENCESLIEVSLPDSVVSIGKRAFAYCKELIEFVIPENLNTIEEGVFEGCSKLLNITIHHSITSINDYAFYGCQSVKNIKLPNSVISIGANAFSFCSNLKEITLSENLNFIGQDAFWGTGITSITIPPTMETINEGAFHGCYELTEINIPNTIKIIGNRTFADCTKLNSINLPNSITSIGDETFYNCQNLSSINIPEKVTYIGQYTFFNCSKLKSIDLPTDIINIGKSAFYQCGISSIVIPSKVQIVNSKAFYLCPLKEIYCKSATPPACGNDILDESTLSNCKLYIPKGNLSSYQSADYWKKFKNIIEEP